MLAQHERASKSAYGSSEESADDRVFASSCTRPLTLLTAGKADATYQPADSSSSQATDQEPLTNVGPAAVEDLELGDRSPGEWMGIELYGVRAKAGESSIDAALWQVSSYGSNPRAERHTRLCGSHDGNERQ